MYVVEVNAGKEVSVEQGGGQENYRKLGMTVSKQNRPKRDTDRLSWRNQNRSIMKARTRKR